MMASKQAVCMVINVFAIFTSVVCPTYAFNLGIIHTNDVHSHVEEMNKYSSDCHSNDCYGGAARRVTKIHELRQEQKNILLLDAGDQFQGTLWYNVYKGAVSAQIMNKLKYDAMSFGNHEFDDGVEGVAPFVDNLTFPIINCNMDVSREPRLRGKFNASIVKEVDGTKVGIIGYLIEETKTISNPGPNVTFNSVKDSMQAEVNKLKSQGVKIIIGVGHYGYGNDIQLAKDVSGLDLIVGGHTHTFLYSGTPPSNDVPEGPYPTIVDKGDGEKTLIVQAYWSAKYLGFINLTFDDNGKVTHWEGQPILLNESIIQDNATLQMIAGLSGPIDEKKKTIVGHSAVFLEGANIICRTQECNLGNLITDGMVAFHAKDDNSSWTAAPIAILNSGGIRAPIDKGQITMGDVLTTMPFGNSVDIIKIKGKYLRQALEHAVSRYSLTNRPGEFLQVSGLRIVYDLCLPSGQRVVSVYARCGDCQIPVYSELEDNKVYSVAALNYIIKGGDGFSVLSEHHEEWEMINSLDADVFVQFLKQRNPIIADVPGRITLLNQPKPNVNPTCSHDANASSSFQPYVIFMLLVTILKMVL